MNQTKGVNQQTENETNISSGEFRKRKFPFPESKHSPLKHRKSFNKVNLSPRELLKRKYPFPDQKSPPQKHQKTFNDIANIATIRDIFDYEVSSDSQYSGDSESSEEEGPQETLPTEVYVNNINTDLLPTIEATVFGVNHSLFLDSGADVCCIKETLADSLYARGLIQQWDSKVRTCRSADRNKLRTAGTIKLVFSIGKQKFSHCFLVIAQLSQSLIIGRDFMKQHNLFLDMGNSKVVINHTSYPFVSDTSHEIQRCEEYDNSTFPSVLREDIKLKPHSSLQARCITNKTTPEGDYIIYPSRQSGSIPDLGVSVGFTFIGPTRKHHILISHTSEAPIHIKADTVLAKLEPRAPHQIPTINSFQDDSTSDLEMEREHLTTNQTSQTASKPTVQDWPQTDLPKQQKKQLMELLNEFSTCFTDSDSEIEFTTMGEYSIELLDTLPVKARSIPCPMHLRAKLKKHITDMLQSGAIQPSISNYSSPAFLVIKNA